MTTLLWQTALLLLGAYFLGAWIACIARRIIYVSTAKVQPAVERQAPAVMPARAPAPQRLADVEPMAPQIAPVGKAAASEPAATVAAPAAPEPAPPAAPKIAPVSPPATPPAARPVVKEPASAEARAQASPIAAAAANAMAATAAARAAQPVTSGAQEIILPAAAGATGQSSTSAPAVHAPAAEAAPSAPDDLTRIRSIDAVIQGELQKLGVRRFAEIAAWRSEDVARVSTALRFSGRIERENWIEQAQILASGRQTSYSERVARGERVTAAPTKDEGQPRKPEAPALPAVGGPSPKPAASPAPAPAAPAATRPAPSSAQARPASPSQPASPPAPAPAATTAAAAASALPRRTAVLGLGRDNFQRIGRISAEVEKLLNVQGVSRYDQIAAWGPNDVTKFDRLLGSDGRIARENWIEQAQILARGGETAYSRDFDSSASMTQEPLRPARLAEAIQASLKSDTPSPKTDDDSARRPDVAALRSVRSEAFRPDAGSAGAAGRSSSQVDDLKRIRGVGVLIEKRLNALGIRSYEQIANWTSADIEKVSRVLDFKGRIERESWVEQARILASGGQTEFARRVERGEIETGRNKT